jgi:hypothetical protein
MLDAARREPGREKVLGIDGAECRLLDFENMRCFRAPRRLERAPRFAAIRGFQGASCGRTFDGRVLCWETGPTRGAAPLVPIDVGKVSDITGGSTLLCVRRQNGKLECFGYPNNTLIMNGAVHKDLKAETIPPLDNIVDVSAQNEHACALSSDGTITCWPRPSGAGRRIPLVSGAQQVAMGLMHACALQKTPEIKCWGTTPPLRSPSTPSTPETKMVIRDATMIGIGLGFACAVKKDGSVVCGSGWDFKPVPGVEKVVALDSGLTGTCAVASDKAIYCWQAGKPLPAQPRSEFQVFSGRMTR